MCYNTSMANHSRYEPQFLNFMIWSDATRLGGVCLRWDSVASELHWRPALAGSDEYWLGLPSPSRVSWKAFWLLLEQAEVWDWESEYPAKTSAHTGWLFETSFRGRRVRTSGGGSAYPNDTDMPGSPFDILLTALGVLAGVEISELRPPNGWGVSKGDDGPPEIDAGDEE